MPVEKEFAPSLAVGSQMTQETGTLWGPVAIEGLCSSYELDGKPVPGTWVSTGQGGGAQSHVRVYRPCPRMMVCLFSQSRV